MQAIYYTIFGYPEKDLNGQLAVITGGGGGLGKKINILILMHNNVNFNNNTHIIIGRLLAMRLSRLGVKVILWDISQEGKKKILFAIINNHCF